MPQQAARQEASHVSPVVDGTAAPDVRAVSQAPVAWVESPARLLHERLSEAFDPHARPVRRARTPVETVTTVLGGVLLGSVVAIWCVLDLAVKSVVGVRAGTVSNP